MIKTHVPKIDSNTSIILISDINMPFIDGWEVLERLKKLDEAVTDRISVFMLSSSVDPYDRERALKNRFVRDYILKPLTPAKVQAMLSHVTLH